MKLPLCVMDHCVLRVVGIVFNRAKAALALAGASSAEVPV